VKQFSQPIISLNLTFHSSPLLPSNFCLWKNFTVGFSRKLKYFKEGVSLPLKGWIVMGASRTRSLLKTISWRVIASLGTVILVYIFTGELTISLGVGALDAIIKTVLYYAHERAWSRIRLGEQPKTYPAKEAPQR